jgi:hypothetical protein
MVERRDETEITESVNSIRLCKNPSSLEEEVNRNLESGANTEGFQVAKLAEPRSTALQTSVRCRSVGLQIFWGSARIGRVTA